MMDVAELRDAETVKGLGKAGKEDVAMRDLDPMALDFACIERESHPGARACEQGSGGA